jgi:hypothetical protein
MLLRKLTTPKEPTRMMSFSYSFNNLANKLEFNSEIDSFGDEFDQRSAYEFPQLDNFISDVI